MCSNSFFWTPVVRELALLGHRSLPVDLPGHGLDAAYPLSYQAPQDLAAFAAAPSPVAEFTLADNVNRVVDIVREVRRHGPVVLVGHSLGGVTIGMVGNVIPDAIDRMVYLSAFCPSTPDAPSAFALSQTPSTCTHWPPVTRASCSGRVNWRPYSANSPEREVIRRPPLGSPGPPRSAGSRRVRPRPG
ncbi:alpha/beta hydrolase [Nocardia sp. CDC159]|uniref:Alpha/beta hydrolase n=1 Tax=Nocardia pulmonis TaxID=2951408 RepID=A0A9X2J265_9NOCA|nr:MULTISPECIES: alpha/beta hydrolase [Nocardia]MCM6778840.1 alpha/beta hydrolase [Nocardia pulmonis]MCM6791729.1 alpha/beta hydrolase [Nocardia sp. CDC159]